VFFQNAAVVPSETTCWTVIRGAAAGRPHDRDAFARRYERVIRSYLHARWNGSPLLGETDDAVQEVFVDCFREGGALERVDPALGRGFRAFLYGVVRNVARRIEHARARADQQPPSGFDPPDREPSLSAVFERAWARSIMRLAAERYAANAAGVGPDCLRRVDLLRLRFGLDLPIREIARQWNEDAAHLHHEYARARTEFRAALIAVVGEHQPGTPGEIERECERLIGSLRR